MNRALGDYIHYVVKPNLIQHGFRKISSRFDVNNIAFAKKNYTVIIDMDYQNKECWLYVKRNDKFIYRKEVSKKQDLKPLLKLTCI